MGLFLYKYVTSVFCTCVLFVHQQQWGKKMLNFGRGGVDQFWKKITLNLLMLLWFRGDVSIFIWFLSTKQKILFWNIQPVIPNFLFFLKYSILFTYFDLYFHLLYFDISILSSELLLEIKVELFFKTVDAHLSISTT